ncbi:MAG: hypothetical protein KDA63_17545 [Planctomycetales bacterium]|nr:hypothetical protein [Planctomycetales bacterium]
MFSASSSEISPLAGAFAVVALEFEKYFATSLSIVACALATPGGVPSTWFPVTVK